MAIVDELSLVGHSEDVDVHQVYEITGNLIRILLYFSLKKKRFGNLHTAFQQAGHITDIIRAMR